MLHNYLYVFKNHFVLVKLKFITAFLLVEDAALHLQELTVTSKVQVALLPEPSVYTYRTWVVPRVKKVPGAWLLDDKVTIPELSVAVGSVQVMMVPLVPKGTV